MLKLYRLPDYQTAHTTRQHTLPWNPLPDSTHYHRTDYQTAHTTRQHTLPDRTHYQTAHTTRQKIHHPVSRVCRWPTIFCDLWTKSNCYTVGCDLQNKSELLSYLLSHLLGLAVADAQSAWLVVRAVGARHQLSEGSRPGEPSLKVKFFCCCIVELTLRNTNLLLITYSFFYYRVSQQQTQFF